MLHYTLLGGSQLVRRLGFGKLQNLGRRRGIAGCWKIPRFGPVLVQRLIRNVKQVRTVEFGKVGQHEFARVRQSLCVRFKCDRNRLFDLGDVPLLRIGVFDGLSLDFKGIRTRHIDRVLLGRVQRSFDALETCKRNDVSRFQAVPALVFQDFDNHVLSLLKYRFDLRRRRGIPILITAHEGLSKVAKDLTKDARRYRINERRPNLPTLVVQSDQRLFRQRNRHRQTRHSGIQQGFQLRGRQFGHVRCDRHGNVRIQFRQRITTERGTTGTTTAPGALEVKVSTQIERRRFNGIRKDQGVKAGQDAVLRNFHSQSAASDNQRFGGHHPALGLVAHDVELTRVQLLVNFRGGARLHGGGCRLGHFLPFRRG
mmetsp:Transcript_70685/g.106942  ORF Transcript_70685/g.106942 Transcript_70685/m.106942 type:complete len:369 (+) Transcript_70685:2124-3230(+)